MELGDLEYVKIPLNANKVFEIHSLSSKGFSKYISNDSCTHKYLEQNVPKSDSNRDILFYSTSKNKFFTQRKNKFDEIKEEAENCLLIGKNDEEKNKQENHIKNEEIKGKDGLFKEEEKNKVDRGEEIKNEENKTNLTNLGKGNQTNDCNQKDFKQFKTQDYFYKPNLSHNNPNHKANFIYENYTSNKNLNQNKKLKLSILNNDTNNEYCLDGNYNSNKIKENSTKFNFNTIYNDSKFSNKRSNNLFSPSFFTSNNTINKTAYQKNLSISTEKNYIYKKSNLDPLSRRLNITSSNFKPTLNTDSTKNCDSRFDKNYLQNLNLFIKSKSYFHMDKLVDTDNSPKTGYDGFESFNIPHLQRTFSNEKDQDNKKLRKPMRLLADKIAKSCIGNKKITFDLSQAESKIIEAHEESEKLKKIMITQTSSDFLRKSKLPEIQSCISQPKLKIRKNCMQGGKIKHMGERYNPYNFQAGRDCETNRRNLTGALFQH